MSALQIFFLVAVVLALLALAWEYGGHHLWARWRRRNQAGAVSWRQIVLLGAVAWVVYFARHGGWQEAVAWLISMTLGLTAIAGTDKADGGRSVRRGDGRRLLATQRDQCPGPPTA